jgi:chromate transporter
MNAAAPSTTEAALRPPPTCGQLFYGFLMLGLTAFGGALPLARRMVVEKHRWLSGPEFTDLLGLCQFLPGGNIINLSVALGMKFRGPRGAFAALMGLILAPSIIVIMLGMVYDRFQDDPHIQHLFAGLAAAAAGLLISMAVKIGTPVFKRRDWLAGAVATVCFIAIAVLRIPLLPTMAVLTPLSILMVWRQRR